jgi:hypothetical protein
VRSQCNPEYKHNAMERAVRWALNSAAENYSRDAHPVSAASMGRKQQYCLQPSGS